MINPDSIKPEIIKLKRGRKSKKDLLAAAAANDQSNIILSIEETFENKISENAFVINNQDNNLFNSQSHEVNDDNCLNIKNVTTNDVDAINDVDTTKSIIKKRGRKPKGGKIIQQMIPLNSIIEPKPNVILHLKCSFKDLQTNTLLSSNVESFNFDSCKGDLSYEIINSNIKGLNNNNLNNINLTSTSINNENIINKYYEESVDSINNEEDQHIIKDYETKEVWKKLKQLEHNLHINNIGDKKSACFWCTYEFDNPPVYIPKHYIKDSYHVYGCFCSPECATAHLMEENIDSSTKFERYYLINNIYAKIYNFKKNIKPAPNPYYMLDKYYGNLTIQEYRALLRNERLFLIVDKPLTRILPELHEDNDDFVINNKIIPSNTYHIKKKLQKKTQNKNSIFNDNFGLEQ